MKDGWHNDEFFALYESREEAENATARYRLAEYLPSYLVVGLRFWDDFIVCDSQDRYFTVPTVPLAREELRAYSFPAESLKLRSDAQLSGRIKWYIQPIIFGGSPSKVENMVWISHDQHFEAVVHWNKLYYELKGKTA
jgi:hypothetical protein